MLLRGSCVLGMLLGLFAAKPCSGEEIHGLDAKGFIRDWLIIGPYPSYASATKPRGFTDDLLKNLGGESAVEPYAGMSDKAVFVADKSKLIAKIGAVNEWGVTETRTVDVGWEELHWREEDKTVISLDKRFGEIRDHLVAYAACYIISPGPQKVQFRLGSDDGYKLYVNHTYVGGLSICRAARPDDNIHNVSLVKGTNPVLLKVVDRVGGHGFCLAVTDPKGKPCKNLKIILTNPKVKYARECSGIDRVDVVDGQAFGQLDLAGDEPHFPGTHVVRIGLGYDAAANTSVELLVTDPDGRQLWRHRGAFELSADVATVFTPEIDCQQAGELTISAVITDRASGRLLGHLKRKVVILDPEAVRGKLSDLRQQKGKLLARTQELEQELKRKQDVIQDLRESIAGQFACIEEAYALNRKNLAEKHGQEGRSVDEPFVPVETPRAELCLNGDGWEIAPAQKAGKKGFDADNPPQTGWTQSRVPVECFHRYFRGRNVPVRGKGNVHYGPNQTLPCGGDYVLSEARTSPALWYRLRFDLPEGWAQRRLTLALHSTSVHVRVFLNDALLTDQKVWCGTVTVDLVDALPAGNVLTVYVGADRTFGPVRRGLSEFIWGIAGDVILESRAPLSVADTWVSTSYRQARIRTRAWIENRSGKKQTAEVRQYCILDGRIRCRVGTKRFEAPVGVAEVRLDHVWTNPELWGIGGEYGRPVLYRLVTDVIMDGTLVDRHFTRFGFREFWIEGHHFYLNGKRIFLQGDNGHFKQNIRRHLDVILPLLRADGINMIRSHQGHPLSYNTSVLPNVADELGMLVCAQMYPILHPNGRGHSPIDTFLSVEEYLAHPLHFQNLLNYSRWVKMMRNHPSVVVYATDNEIFTQAWDTPEKLAFNIRNDQLGAIYGQYVKQLDSTRVLTRDGDEGTWGHKGKWQEDPPCDTANYHYPDFHVNEFVLNWETVYDGRPVIFGETLYHSYGAWDGWVGAIPSQVAAKAAKVRKVASLYRDLEVPGAIYMALSLDGFIQLDPDGCGPWRLTPEMLAEYKANKIIKAMPHYPYLPVPWPSYSGPGCKKEFAIITAGMHGERGINWFDIDAPTHVRNAVNDAYRESLTPMPPLKPNRTPELLVRVRQAGKAAAGRTVFLLPAGNQGTGPTGVVTDSRGTAWFVAPEPGAYTVSAGNTTVDVMLAPIPNAPPQPGFEYLKPIEIEILEDAQ